LYKVHKILTLKKQINSFRGKCLETKNKYRVLKLQFIRSRVLYLQYFLHSLQEQLTHERKAFAIWPTACLHWKRL
jgi:hypothetical protein